MKKTATIILLLAITVSLQAQHSSFYQYTNHAQGIKAVWLATIGGIDWPSVYAQSPASAERQKAQLRTILDKLEHAGINTILLQTRIRGTVIYPSDIEPWDGCMSGKPGTSPGYDPLRFAIDECHKRSMELHAWVVTIPVGKWNALGCRTLRTKHPALIQKTGPDGYMNPEKPQTGDHIAAICAEISRKYDIDGIHLDYIRYPETWQPKTSRQQARQHITSIVAKVHHAVKNTRSDIKISCSPIGKYKDLPLHTSRGWNAYDKGCQDAQAWLRDGLMDQLYPMMYFRGNDFYPFACDWMQNSHGKDISAGLGIYFLDPKEGNWKIDEIKRQMNVARNLGMGISFFRAKYLLDNVQGIYDYLCHEYHYTPLVSNIRPPHGRPAAPHTQQPGLWNNGTIMRLPDKGHELDADYITIESLTGQIISVKPFAGKYSYINDIPDGSYFIKSINKKGVTHRIGRLFVKRK